MNTLAQTQTVVKDNSLILNVDAAVAQEWVEADGNDLVSEISQIFADDPGASEIIARYMKRSFLRGIMAERSGVTTPQNVQLEIEMEDDTLNDYIEYIIYGQVG